MAETDAPVLSLPVAEALPKDVGRGIARVDPEAMAGIGLRVGDIVRLVGKRETAAKVMPTYPEDRGKRVVQIDGIIRENVRTGIGEQVRLQRASFAEAHTVVLTPTSAGRPLAPGRDTRYLARTLEGLPVLQGDRVRAALWAGRHQEFSVVETSPGGVVVIGARTAVKVKPGRPETAPRGDQAARDAGVTYEDIGGLRREVQKIREMIELPLKHPELFERLGIDAPRGVLLQGPPGCGKTLIARAVANETEAAFFQVSGPEVIHKFYGESEAHLRAIFDQAREQAPAIIFIDEIDAIAAKREEVRGDQQVERRVVAQLLALLDGLKSRGQVIVIAATNLPQVLDPALRRPGRFDRELVISVPDKHGRLEILQIHTRGMPLAGDVELARLAEVTHGFVGADLEALCREAAMTVLRRVLPQLRLDVDQIPDEVLAALEVTMADYLEALKEVEPSAIREVFTEIPDVRWEDVGGLDALKQAVIEAIEWPLKYADLFACAGARPPKGILLAGPPGAGKTLLAQAVASQSGVNFISVKGPELLSRWVGESEKGVREVFRKARQASPCIIFFDEIDALTPVRGGGSDSHVTERVISQLLTELDGIEELKGVIVLAATNRPDIIDPALLRAGRFDLQLALPAPDAAARREILAVHTRAQPLAADVDLDRLAATTDGFLGADIAALCRRAAMLAIRERLRGGGGAPAADTGGLNVAARHFERALVDLTPPTL